MPNTKLHPSIVLHITRDGATYTESNRVVSADDVAEVSAELWEVTLTKDSKPTRKLRDDPWEW